MRSLLLIVVSALALGPSSGKAPSERGRTPMPAKLYGTSPSEYPVWVDKRIAVNPNGTVNRMDLHPAYARAIEEVLQAGSSGDCVDPPAVYASRVDLQPRGSLEEAVDTAQLVMLSRVTGRSYGFYGGEAGQLLRLSPTLIYKGKADHSDYYTFIPVGDFELGRVHVCKTDSRFAEPPEIGDRILTFTHPPDSRILDPEDPGDIIVLHSSGRVSFPKNYRGKETESMRGAESQARSLLERIAGLSASKVTR